MQRTFHEITRKPLLWGKVMYASELETLLAIEAHGDLNPIQRSRLAELKKTGDYGNPTGVESQGSFGNTTGTSGLDSTGQYIQNAVQKLDEAYFSKIKEFNTNNPFVYDDILKQEIAKAGTRLDPYYMQSLNDYTKGIELQRNRSLEDQRTTLGNLNADINSYSQENRQSLDAALEKSRSGYADVGLYQSGQQQRNTATQGLDSNQNLQNYMVGKDQQVQQANTTNTRNQEDASLKQSQYNREIGSIDPLTGLFKRGATSEAEVRSQAGAQVPVLQSQRQFALGNYVGPAPGQDPNLFYLNNYSNLQ